MTFAEYARIISSPDPVNAQDLATKNYADNLRRTYMCRAYLSTAGYTMPSTASQEVQPFPFNSLSQGSSSIYITASGPNQYCYVCPVAGVYLARVSISYSFSATGQSGSARIWWNAALNSTATGHSSFAAAYAVTNTVLINAAAGDTISGAAQTSLANCAIRNVSAETIFMCCLLGAM